MITEGIQLTGVHHCPCSHCAKAKIRMKNIPKEAHEQSQFVVAIVIVICVLLFSIAGSIVVWLNVIFLASQY
jgi:hypothetical protein